MLVQTLIESTWTIVSCLSTISKLSSKFSDENQAHLSYRLARFTLLAGKRFSFPKYNQSTTLLRFVAKE